MIADVTMTTTTMATQTMGAPATVSINITGNEGVHNTMLYLTIYTAEHCYFGVVKTMKNTLQCELFE